MHLNAARLWQLATDIQFARLVAAALVGVVAANSFAPWEQWLLMPPSLMLLFYLILTAQSWRTAAMTGFVFGMTFFACGLWWIFGALNGYIGLPFIAAFIIMFLLCALLSFYPALIAAGARWIGKNNLRGALSLAALWAITEWLRGELFSGFPWLAIGYSQTPDSPFFGWLPLVGIAGVNFILALFCVLPFAVKKLRGRLIVAMIMLFLIGGGIGAKKIEWTEATDTITISLLQGNVIQKLKWQPGAVKKALSDYLRLAQNASGQIIIMPETAIPMRLTDLPKDYLSSLQRIAKEKQGAIVTGMFIQEEDDLYNAAVAIDGTTHTPDNATQTTLAIKNANYRKQHLTPYGEYLPFATVLRPLLLAADIPYNSLASGGQQQPINLPGALAAVAICYEDIFSNEWRKQLPQAQFLINITNDGWFDGSAMQAQHRQISQARAAEFGRSLARAANTGITALINHQGHIISELPANTQAALHGEITLRKGSTPFVRFGELPILILAGLIIIAAVIWRQKSLSNHFN